MPILCAFACAALLVGCTAGDIRVNFQVADPRSLSVVAMAVGTQGAAEGAGAIDLMPYTAPNGFQVAIAHAGELSKSPLFFKSAA